MGVVNPTLQDRVRFTLYNRHLDPLVITDPINWDNDEKELARNGKYEGLYTKFSNSLEFIGDSASYIKLVDDLYGVNEDIRIVKEEKHPKTDEWERSYETFLDLSTMVKKDGKVSIKSNAGGLEKILKARESEDIELERLTTLDGQTLPPLRVDKLALSGRQVFLESLLNVRDIDKEDNSIRMKQSSGNFYGQLTVPLTIDYKSDEHIHSTYRNQFHVRRSLDPGRAESLFYAINDRTKILHIDFKFDCTIIVDSMSPSPSGVYVGLELVIYNNGSDYNVKERKTLYQVPNPYAMHGHKMTVDFTEDIELLEGESMAILWVAKGYFDGELFAPNDYLYIRFNVSEGILNINEDSVFNETRTNVVLPYEALNRIIQVMTGRDDLLYSEALGRTDLGYAKDGIASLVGIAHGFWFRGFTKDDELYKGITVSMKDFLESYLKVFNLSMGIEKRGYKEIVRIEHESYFYNRNTTIPLGKERNGKFEYISVTNLEEKKEPDYYYSSVEVGYEKPDGNRLYEEAVGLIEYNGKNTYTTCIDRVNNRLMLVSRLRADLMGVEFARRKQKVTDPTADTSYDNDVFMLDMKRGPVNVFELRKWQDDFEEAPKGTYSPETAGNLRLSPFNILLRNGSKLQSGLTKYPYEHIRYGSSTANSNLETKLIGKPAYKENKDGGIIRNDELEKARFLPISYKFEFQVDFDLSQKLQNNSNILGNLVPNTYGLVAFKDREGNIIRGYLEKLRPNGKGDWELKKYNE